MARFDTAGIDDIIQSLIQMGEGSGELADELLLAGAEEVKQAWKTAALQHGLKDTGDMINSIGYPREPKDINGIRSIDIYPQGKDRKGVRNAEKAFIWHYGTSKRPGKHWIDDADKLSAPEVERVFTEKYDEFLQKEGK